MEGDKKPFYKYCIVPMCNNNTKSAPDKVYLPVPRKYEVRRKWYKAMRRDNGFSKNSLYCCEDHFTIDEDTDNYARYKIMALHGQKVGLRLKKDVVPHIFKCQKVGNQKPVPERMGAIKRRRIELVAQAISEYALKQTVPIPNEDSERIHHAASPSLVFSGCEMSSDVGPSNSNITNILMVDKAVQVKTKELHFKNLMRTGMVAAIERKPNMLLGLPKRSYYLIKLLSDNIPLPTIHIMITLKKIKLNESFDIIALHFGYTQSTVSRIFSKSVPLIAEKAKELIVWPTPDDIFKNLPISFRARHKNVVSIIDCLEIEIEKPSNVVHQSLTWSQYKKCNTLKYLVSCTPDGLVNFISEGYGGRATDLMIVEDSCFLECLPHNKAVMADRGFKNLSSLLRNKNCTLVRPPSVFNDTPSTKREVKQSKRIAALRIHVERVRNRLRNFHMLLPHACVDHNLIPLIDQVIVVACGLINMKNVLIRK